MTQTLITQHSTIVIHAEDYVSMILTIADMNAPLNTLEVDDIISLAYEESKVIGADEDVMFTEIDFNRLEAKLFNDKKIVISRPNPEILWTLSVEAL